MHWNSIQQNIYFTLGLVSTRPKTHVWVGSIYMWMSGYDYKSCTIYVVSYHNINTMICNTLSNLIWLLHSIVWWEIPGNLLLDKKNPWLNNIVKFHIFDSTKPKKNTYNLFVTYSYIEYKYQTSPVTTKISSPVECLSPLETDLGFFKCFWM